MAISNTINPLTMFNKPVVTPTSIFSSPTSVGTATPQNSSIVPKTGTITAPKKTVSAPVSSSVGSYKGTPITAGTDAEVAAQIAKIDAQNTPNSTKGLVSTTPTISTTPTPSTTSYAPTTSSTTSPSYAGLVGTLANTAQNGSQAVQDANKALTDFRTNLQTQYGNIESEPIPLEFQQGREQVLARQAAGQEAALQSGVTNALTGQGQQLNALGTAAGLAQPSTAAYGQTVFNPLTGTYSGGGNLDPQTQATTLAQQVMNGQLTYDQAISSLGYAGSAGTNFLNNAITSAGGNPLQLQAKGSTTQSVIGTQGTQQAQYQSALQQGQNLQSQLSDLITTFGLNPNDINAVNSGLQKIAQNTSSPQYKILQNYVNDIANTYAQILTPPGGSATDTSRGIASSMLDATASGQSILTVMKSLDEAAKAKISGISTTGGTINSFQTGQTSADGSLKWNGSQWVKA